MRSRRQLPVFYAKLLILRGILSGITHVNSIAVSVFSPEKVSAGRFSGPAAIVTMKVCDIV